MRFGSFPRRRSGGRPRREPRFRRGGAPFRGSANACFDAGSFFLLVRVSAPVAAIEVCAALSGSFGAIVVARVFVLRLHGRSSKEIEEEATNGRGDGVDGRGRILFRSRLLLRRVRLRLNSCRILDRVVVIDVLDRRRRHRLDFRQSLSLRRLQLRRRRIEVLQKLFLRSQRGLLNSLDRITVHAYEKSGQRLLSRSEPLSRRQSLSLQRLQLRRRRR